MSRHRVWPFNPTVSYSVHVTGNEVLCISVKSQIIMLKKLHTLVLITTQIWSNWRNHLMFFKTPHAWTFCSAERERWAISPMGCFSLKNVSQSVEHGQTWQMGLCPRVINVAFPPLFMTHQTFTGFAWIWPQIEPFYFLGIVICWDFNNHLFFTIYCFFLFLLKCISLSVFLVVSDNVDSSVFKIVLCF